VTEFVVTVIKTREERYVVEAENPDHAVRLVCGEGHLISDHAWVDVVDQVQPYRPEAKP
jgi:hypothetical protein